MYVIRFIRKPTYRLYNQLGSQHKLGYKHTPPIFLSNTKITQLCIKK